MSGLLAPVTGAGLSRSAIAPPFAAAPRMGDLRFCGGGKCCDPQQSQACPSGRATLMSRGLRRSGSQASVSSLQRKRQAACAEPFGAFHRAGPLPAASVILLATFCHSRHCYPPSASFDDRKGKRELPATAIFGMAILARASDPTRGGDRCCPRLAGSPAGFRPLWPSSLVPTEAGLLDFSVCSSVLSWSLPKTNPRTGPRQAVAPSAWSSCQCIIEPHVYTYSHKSSPWQRSEWIGLAACRLRCGPGLDSLFVSRRQSRRTRAAIPPSYPFSGEPVCLRGLSVGILERRGILSW